MKIKFDKKITPLENIKEEPLKKRYWDRWIYIGVLIILLVTFLKWLIFPWFFDSAQGILLQQQYDVKIADDIRIIEYKVKEGQNVKPGDTLFTFERVDGNRKDINFSQDSIQVVLKQNNLKNSIIALDGQIEKRRLFLMDLHKRIDYWKTEKLRKEKLVYLDVITPNELANVDRSIDAVSYEIATVKAEYNVLIKERSELLKESNESNALNLKSISLSRNTTEAFKALVGGKIDRLIIPEKQISYKEDKITSIIYPDYFVRAYIDMSDLGNFNLGDNVTVILPYNSKNLAGKVHKIYSVSELKNDIVYENTISDKKYGIVIEIIPTNKNDWNSISLSNIPVKVRKGKINI